MEYLGTIIMATGALGTACFGIVEALKIFPLWGNTGFGVLRNQLQRLTDALHVAYGDHYETLLKGHYRGPSRDLARIIRQGVRVGLHPDNAKNIAESIGFGQSTALAKIAAKLQAGKKLSDAERNLLGRYELAVDTRIDAALYLAQNRYAAGMRCWASGFALVITWSVYQYFFIDDPKVEAVHALIVGIGAVPLAPITKDLVTALQAAGNALRARP